MPTDTVYYAAWCAAAPNALARPGRRRKRLDTPDEWDILHGLILSYREGDIPVVGLTCPEARRRERIVMDCLPLGREYN
jgi:hypothetical protein